MSKKNVINKSFRGLRVFVFRYRVKNENAELAESFLYHVLFQVRIGGIGGKFSKHLVF